MKKRGSVLPAELPLHIADWLLALQRTDDAPLVRRLVLVFPRCHVGRSDHGSPCGGMRQSRTGIGSLPVPPTDTPYECGHRRMGGVRLGIDDRIDEGKGIGLPLAALVICSPLCILLWEKNLAEFYWRINTNSI